MSNLAQGASTNSKRYSCYSYNAGSAKHDFVCGLGSQIDGWKHNKCITHIDTEAFAAYLSQRFGYDSVKFTSSGSEACSAAVRIARAYTGKMQVYQSGYHGHQDWTCSNKFPTGNHVPNQRVTDFSSNKELLQVLKVLKDDHDVACVIIEPLMLNDDEDNYHTNTAILAECSRLGIISIFDEIITGLRVPHGLWAKDNHTFPDLVCMGKAAGNGLPISWVMGSNKLMESAYFISSTHAGNEHCCREAHKLMLRLSDEVIYKFFTDCHIFMAEIQGVLEGTGIELKGYGTRGEWICTDLDLLTAFFELMADKGFLVGRAFFVNMQHTKAIKKAFVIAVKKSIGQILTGYKAKGPIISFSFKRN